MQQEFNDIGVTFEPFRQQQAEIAARLWSRTYKYGLSLADRACLALAMNKNVPALTADRVWHKLKLDMETQLVR